jgi:hypothetical protein
VLLAAMTVTVVLLATCSPMADYDRKGGSADEQADEDDRDR